MARITVTLTPEEKAALLSLAQQQRRDPRAQAAIELQRALVAAGYLPLPTPAGQLPGGRNAGSVLAASQVS